MAGQRRGTGKSTIRVAREQRRTRNVNDRLGATQDPKERIGIAADHYRSALAVNPDAAAAELVVEYLIDKANELFRARMEVTR